MVNRHFNVALPMLEKAEDVIAAADVVFSCLPHGHAEEAGHQCMSAGKPFIDISADFRFGAHEEIFKSGMAPPTNIPNCTPRRCMGFRN